MDLVWRYSVNNTETVSIKLFLSKDVLGEPIYTAEVHCPSREVTQGTGNCVTIQFLTHVIRGFLISFGRKSGETPDEIVVEHGSKRKNKQVTETELQTVKQALKEFI